MPPVTKLCVWVVALGLSCGESTLPPAPLPAEPRKEVPAAAKEALAKGREHFQRDAPFEAIPELRRAVELAPDWAEARLALGKLLYSYSKVEFSTGTFDRGRVGEAAEQFDRACELTPEDPEASYWSGLAWQRLEQPAKAVQRFERVLALRPEHAAALKELGMLYRTEGDFERARPLLERARAQLPTDDEVLFQIGLLLDSLDELEGAREAYLAAAALNPIHPGPYSRLTQLHLRLGDPAASEAARLRFERVKELAEQAAALVKNAERNLKDPAALVAVAQFFHTQGMRGPARSWLERALRLAPEDPAARALSQTLAEVGG